MISDILTMTMCIYAFDLIATRKYKQYNKKPTIVAMTRPLLTMNGPKWNIEYVSFSIFA